MHILIAPDSFKESLSAPKVAQSLQKGFSKSLPQATFDLLPLGDGGEGTLEALAQGLHLKKAAVKVSGPFGDLVEAEYAFKDDLAVFEIAAITGLEQIPKDKRNPLTISNRGIGELIVFLAQKGMKRLMIGVGGSSTNDGGIGMAEGLGYAFFDASGNKVEAVGDNLGKIVGLSDQAVPSCLKNLEVTIITDVTHYLCGPQGAAYTFAGQKGLAKSAFEAADKAMQSFYKLVNPGIFNLQGAGAGGGLAAGLVTFAAGKIVSGIDAVLDNLDFERHVQKADLVIVGEGRMDKQSLSGKAPVGVARRTPANIPVIAVCGSLAEDLPDFPLDNIQAVFPIISEAASLEHTLARAADNLERTAANIGSLLQINL
ncbi:glycerate kinase [Streptococcus macacae]|uniref:Glycerate kinase n=1 Tax=Streptococcus macacae NCTC 11558 TaxID=764298 RepID=G5JYZ6_9STRE|nr:glycerate kinase [Streptococcus macacae]EHJ52081.1 glycerate kinase [Streptococcus macacae NCTC 11558]SUN78252.1 glycerate kinase [Streptococcus macacae NCTC 11558]